MPSDSKVTSVPSAVASSWPVAPSMLTCGSVTPPNSGFLRRARRGAGRRGSGPGRRRSAAARPRCRRRGRGCTLRRGRPASSAGAASWKSSRFCTSSRPVTWIGLALGVDAGRRVELGDLRALGRRRVDLRRRDRAVVDLGRLELEHRVLRALGVDGGAQRHAAGGVPGQLGRAEQPAVVLGRDPDGVARPVGGRGGRRAGQRPQLAELGESLTDAVERRGLAVGLSRSLLSGSEPVKAVFDAAS